MEKIKADMHILPENDKVLAAGTVTIAGFMVIKNVRVMKGVNGKESFVSMPGEQTAAGWRNIAYAITPDMQGAIKAAVMEAVKEAVVKDMGVSKEDLSIEIKPIAGRDKLKGMAVIQLEGVKINGIKILEKSGNTSEYYVSMPQYKTVGRNGTEWHDIVYPTTSMARAHVNEWILEAYQEKMKSLNAPAQPQKSVQEEVQQVIADLTREIEEEFPLSDEKWDEVIKKVSTATAHFDNDPEVARTFTDFLTSITERLEGEEAELELQKELTPKL